MKDVKFFFLLFCEILVGFVFLIGSDSMDIVCIIGDVDMFFRFFGLGVLGFLIWRIGFSEVDFWVYVIVGFVDDIILYINDG